MAKKLETYIGKLMCPTAKGIKRGDYIDSLYPVVDVVEDQGRKYLLAWKCQITANGRVDHPAYSKSTLKFDDPRLFIKKAARNGATPTAMFRPDSLYMLFMK